VAASHLRYGDPVTEIVRLATELEPGTIVIGSRTHGVIRRLAMGSVVEQLAARSITPVLVVQKAASSWPPTSVALVLDQTASSHAVFMTAALFAARYRIKVRLIAGTGGPSPDLVWARHRVEQMQARVRTDVKLERVVPDGGLENCLLRLAAAGALIATGSPAGGLWHRVVSQSLALKLLRHCPGSLLIVPAA
jgi:nucleotide-binding universal stress UspA family protein